MEWGYLLSTLEVCQVRKPSVDRKFVLPTMVWVGESGLVLIESAYGISSASVKSL